MAPPINTLHLAILAGAEYAPHIAAVRSHLLVQGRLW